MVFEQLGVSSDIFSQGLAGGAFFLKIIVFGLAAMGIMFLVYKLFFEYYIAITLLKPIGKSSFAWSSDRAKIVTNKEDNTRQMVLMRTREGPNKITCAVPAHDFKGKKGKADHYMFLVDDNFQLQSVSVNLVVDELQNPHLKLFPQDKRWWARKEDKRRLEKYAKQDMLSKYLPSMVIILAFVITFFIAYFGFSHLGDGMGRLAGEFGNVAAQCAAF
tara:strand:+ start:1922 stop:2572 length:651 start_codon:yes stop_codon:yes gene_type:complete